VSDERTDIEGIEAAIERAWSGYAVAPEAMWFSTPFGCLRVTSQSAVLVGDEGEELEDQSNAAAALAYVHELANPKI
jgi:hypothetical protein